MTAIGGRRRAGLPIFLRTFLLLLVALLIAHASGMVMFTLRKPPANDIRLSDVVALLSSQMPPANGELSVHESPAEPTPHAGYQEDRRLRGLLAEWLGVAEDRVRFHRALPPGMPAPRPEDTRPGLASPALPLYGPAPEWPGMAMSPEELAGARWRSDSPLPRAFVGALREPDGRWRVVERSNQPPGRTATTAMLFLVGALILLPLAWWFSRAMAAPIRRFAHAAERMGRDASATPLPLQGPAEIAHAASAFNVMQARINRLLRERMQMVGAIAHDLRTPLTRLAFRLEFLPPEMRDKATADLEEMSQMIRETLAFLQEHNREGAYEALDLRQLAEDVVGGLRDTGHDAVLEPGASAPMQGDPLALRRMIANLADNALKYGGHARIRLLDAGDGHELQVDDDGPGIDPGQHDQLFLPFVRGDDSRNRKTGGTGLGLASARDVAMAHGGEIRLRNLDGGGLRATVSLPHAAGGRRAAGASPVRGRESAAAPVLQ
ncbi:MAG: ATP-binding protein [Pseudoxanthomonas sp.]